MTNRVPRRPGTSLVLPIGLLIRTVVATVLTLAAFGIVASGTLSRLAGASTVADRNAVAAQQAVTERDLERGYEQATDHVRQARNLKLAISAAQADTIANKALADLATLRHSALLSVAQLLGATTDASEAYAKSTEQTLDAKRAQTQPSVEPVLLAPRLYAIVSRFNQLAAQLADQAITDLTQAPSPPPSQLLTPTPSPTASPRATPNPSPTR